jgi:hypothetical protein
VLLDTEISNELPFNEYLPYFGPDFTLHPPPTRVIENMNTREYLEGMVMNVTENLRLLEHAPAVQMQERAPDFYAPEEDWDESSNPDSRNPVHWTEQNRDAQGDIAMS